MVAMGDKCLTDGEVLCMYAASEEQLLCGAVNKINIQYLSLCRKIYSAEVYIQ